MPVPVYEDYRNRCPLRPLKAYVDDLVAIVPPHHLAGLDHVMLTDAHGMPRDERRKKTWSRNKKIRLAETRGYYRHASREARAHIVLHIDNIQESVRRRRRQPVNHGVRYNLVSWLSRPFHARLRLAEVPYHEIGHHIHFTQCPDYREPENVAERYRFQLTKRFIMRRWYLLALAIVTIAAFFPAHFARILIAAFGKSRVTAKRNANA